MENSSLKWSQFVGAGQTQGPGRVHEISIGDPNQPTGS